MSRKPLDIKIKHPGLLKRAAKRAGRSVNAEAEYARTHGNKILKRAANLYINVFKH